MIVAFGTPQACLRHAAAVLAVLALCGCAREKPKRFEENPVPIDYRGQIAEQVRVQLNPRNVRDAYIAEPVLKSSLQPPRYISCVRFTSTDAAGTPRGTRDYAAYFFAGKVTQVVNAGADLCGDANYQPFPELLPPR